MLLALLTGCETTQQPTNATTTQTTTPKQPTNSIPKQTPTGIVFNTSDLLYTGGLGEAGVEGFCRRIGAQVAEKFAEIGIKGVSNTLPQPDQAKITVTLSTIEAKSGVGLDILFGSYGAQKIGVRYSAQLDSPTGTTLATWKYELDDGSIDKLTDHIASDIVKYLKHGFK